jgi:hypothetical protein
MLPLGMLNREAYMSDTKYIDFYEITALQIKIMKFVDIWATEKKVPIPQKEIIKAMELEGIKNYTSANALNSLMKKGYLRHAIITSNQTYYVQLKRL